jgi:hypothetical protein
MIITYKQRLVVQHKLSLNKRFIYHILYTQEFKFFYDNKMKVITIVENH